MSDFNLYTPDGCPGAPDGFEEATGINLRCSNK